MMPTKEPKGYVFPSKKPFHFPIRLCFMRVPFRFNLGNKPSSRPSRGPGPGLLRLQLAANRVPGRVDVYFPCPSARLDGFRFIFSGFDLFLIYFHLTRWKVPPAQPPVTKH